MGRKIGAARLATAGHDFLGHPSAFISAALASLGALPAMLHLAVPGAFLRAHVAYFGANLANRAGQLAAAGHVACGQAADRRAIDVKLNAARHRLDIFFAQARRGTVVAGLSTGIAGVDAGSELLVRHAGLLGKIRIGTSSDAEVQRIMMMEGSMSSMMGLMVGLGLLGWVLVIALLAIIVVLLVRILRRSAPRDRTGAASPPPRLGSPWRHIGPRESTHDSEDGRWQQEHLQNGRQTDLCSRKDRHKFGVLPALSYI